MDDLTQNTLGFLKGLIADKKEYVVPIEKKVPDPSLYAKEKIVYQMKDDVTDEDSIDSEEEREDAKQAENDTYDEGDGFVVDDVSIEEEEEEKEEDKKLCLKEEEENAELVPDELSESPVFSDSSSSLQLSSDSEDEVKAEEVSSSSQWEHAGDTDVLDKHHFSGKRKPPPKNAKKPRTPNIAEASSIIFDAIRKKPTLQTVNAYSKVSVQAFTNKYSLSQAKQKKLLEQVHKMEAELFETKKLPDTKQCNAYICVSPLLVYTFVELKCGTSDKSTFVKVREQLLESSEKRLLKNFT